MTDVREDILARLRLVAAGVADIRTAVRNQVNVDDTDTPAVAILEGDEEPSPFASEGRKIAPGAATPIMMVPQVVVLVSDKTVDVGATLNAFRAKVIKAVMFDAELIALLGSNGSIIYRGMESDLAVGRQMLGRMALRFGITYMLQPAKL